MNLQQQKQIIDIYYRLGEHLKDLQDDALLSTAIQNAKSIQTDLYHIIEKSKGEPSSFYRNLPVFEK